MIYWIILSFFTAFAVVLFGTPSLIKVAKLKRLVDEPSEERKVHTRSVPTIGGIMIFAAFIFSVCLWYPESMKNIASGLNDLKYLIATLIVLFFVGIKDDIIGTAPIYKLIAHLIVGFIIVMMADIRIESMHGLFGMTETLPAWASIMLTMFVYVVVVNAFNLIDGVDGLAGGTGFIITLFYTFWFYHLDQPDLALISMALSGSLAGFLIFNFNPARIFMGDSGSLIIGAIVVVLTIRAIEVQPAADSMFASVSTPVLAMACLSYPLIDTLRVFTIRAIKGKSPMSADRNHIHHRLMDAGFGHKKTVFTLYAFTCLIISTALFSPFSNPTWSFILSSLAVAFTVLIIFVFTRKSK